MTCFAVPGSPKTVAPTSFKTWTFLQTSALTGSEESTVRQRKFILVRKRRPISPLLLPIPGLGLPQLFAWRSESSRLFDFNGKSPTSVTLELRTPDLAMGSSMTEEATIPRPKTRSLVLPALQRRTRRSSRQPFRSETASELGRIGKIYR